MEVKFKRTFIKEFNRLPENIKNQIKHLITHEISAIRDPKDMRNITG